jgi:hypothetical protein
MTHQERFQETASEFARVYKSGEFEELYRRLGSGMQREFSSKQFGDFLNRLRSDLGSLLNFSALRSISPSTAATSVQFERGALELKITIDNQGKITGLQFSSGQDDFNSIRNRTEMVLPFNGTWMVLWGGDTPQLNQHHAVLNQRFAFDFLVVADLLKTCRDKGVNNEDYYAFGKEVLAPADGTIIDVISGVRDNPPGSMNPYSALGNCVLIQHSAGEISVLAHLRAQSIEVSVGDKVQKGQVVGTCGNSGNSSEPHLHFHLQDTPLIQSAVGIKCFFSRVQLYHAGQVLIKHDYSPIKGNLISS